MTNLEKGLFHEVLGSQVTAVKCRGCGCDTVVNSVYVPYLVDGTIESCRGCREAMFGDSK
jgi:hypothetical protein